MCLILRLKRRDSTTIVQDESFFVNDVAWVYNLWHPWENQYTSHTPAAARRSQCTTS